MTAGALYCRQAEEGEEDVDIGYLNNVCATVCKISMQISSKDVLLQYFTSPVSVSV